MMLLQDGPPDRSGATASADDRDRGRRQHGPHARHVRGPLPHGDRIAVGAQRGVRLVGGQRERQVIHAVRQGALCLQPGVGEHPQHSRVLAERLRGKRADPPAAGHRDQVLQQQHADAAVMHVIGDREGDLRRPGPGPGPLVGAAADHLPVQHRQQRRVVRPGLAAYPARLLLGRERAHAEEPQIQVVRGHLGVHVPHRVEVLGPRGPDLDRGAVGQQSVTAVLRVDAHAVLPPRLATPRPRPHYRLRRHQAGPRLLKISVSAGLGVRRAGRCRCGGGFRGSGRRGWGSRRRP